MLITAHFARALPFMVAYIIIKQASALATAGMIMRKRPTPFASKPTMPPGLVQYQRLRARGEYSPGPTTASPIGYTNLGCWKDTTTRVLSGTSTVGNDIDVEICQSFCSQNSFFVFGVEAANNCFCGSALAARATSASSDDCSTACTANLREICGATWRINIYSFVPTTASPIGYSNWGCYTDNSDRILSGSSTYGSHMAVQPCQEFCSQNSYTIFGVEAANYCYCGNYLNQPDIGTADDCNFACAGNPQEICGANWRINVYGSSSTRETATSVANNSIGTPDSGSTNSKTLGLSLGLGIPTLFVAIIGLLFGNGLYNRIRYRALR